MSGTIKKIKSQRINAFELWCWRRLFRVSWTARSNQSSLKEINPEYSLGRLVLKLKLQYYGQLVQRANSLEKNPDAVKDCGQEKKGTAEDELVRLYCQLNRHEFKQILKASGGHRRLMCCNSWICKELNMT